MAPTVDSPTPAPASWPRTLREGLLIGLFALALNLAGNGSRGLWDRDEPRYAGCTREMRLSGDWIHPTFNAEPRYYKPVLIYWLMLGGTALGGDNAFGARLVPALAGVGACLMVWGLGRRLFGPNVGRLAALFLATAPLFVYNAKAATIDATLVCFHLGCMWALWELSRAPSRAWAAVFWGCLALAVLDKGPVTPVFLVLAAAVGWWWRGPTAWWGRLRWRWGLPAFGLIVAPWYVAIGIISRGDFYRVALGYHVLKRMTTGIETHGAPPGYYTGLTAATFYPWSALLPVALLAAWQRRRTTPAFGFLLGWVVGPLAFLECVPTKLIHYYLPALPACAILAAWGVERVAESGVNLRRWPLGRVSVGLLAGVGFAMTVGLLAGALLLPWDLRLPLLVMAAILGPTTLYAMERFQNGAIERASLGLVAAWAAILLIAFGWLGPAVDPYRVTPKVARGLEQLARAEGATPALVGFKAPSIVYELGRPAPILESYDDLTEYLGRDGAVVAALKEREIEAFRKDARLTLDVRGRVSGLDTENPLRDDRLHLVILRPASRLAGAPQEAAVK